jgi:hypothetical protein
MFMGSSVHTAVIADSIAYLVIALSSCVLFGFFAAQTIRVALDRKRRAVR